MNGAEEQRALERELILELERHSGGIMHVDPRHIATLA